MKDRLTEIVKPFVSGSACEHESGSCELTDCRSCNARSLADHLLADGWIRPPCKVGQMVYQTDGTRIYESCITHIEIYSFATVFYTDGVTFDETAIGQSIYLTREQAERALAERSEK